MENKPAFYFEAFKKQAAARLKKGATLLGNEGVFTPLIKEFLEEALDGELEAHIGSQEESNRKNGKGRKQVKTPVGNVEISTPRDRNGTFEPEIQPNDRRRLEWIRTGKLSPYTHTGLATLTFGIT